MIPINLNLCCSTLTPDTLYHLSHLQAAKALKTPCTQRHNVLMEEGRGNTSPMKQSASESSTEKKVSETYETRQQHHSYTHDEEKEDLDSILMLH
ncbi:hypothetical protein VZT92_016101 [Zoarces viviparus]|uniref:Uncharacterized protein n=1 Tax=Zoarces viviparus TaxID=48416 RepID=A0AAW1ESV2_ZOAVI